MEDPKIVKNKEVCNGRPAISGTRIKVSQIAIEFEHMGMSPDDIVQAHPHLNLSQVHAALSYYYQHADEIRGEISENKNFVQMLKKTGPKLGRLEYA